MPISSNNTHISFNNNSTQNTAFLGSIAAANITGQITAPQIAPGVIPSGGFTNIFTSTTPGPASWPAPPSTSKIKVTVVGGGGGGGGRTGGESPIAGTGGGGGGYAIKIIPVTGGTSYPYTIGGAGAPGPAGATGGTGGTTSFGSPATVSATGGSAGSPGLGSSGDINFRGHTQIGPQGAGSYFGTFPSAASGAPGSFAPCIGPAGTPGGIVIEY